MQGREIRPSDEADFLRGLARTLNPSLRYEFSYL